MFVILHFGWQFIGMLLVSGNIPVSNQMWMPFFQMLMNALVEAITVMLMQPVLTQMGTLPAPAMKGTVVMEASVMVNMNIQYFSLVN